MLQNRNYASPSHKQGLFRISQELSLPLTYFCIFYLWLVIVPSWLFRQIVANFLELHLTKYFSWFSNFRCKKDTISHHELCVNFINWYIVGEFIPHCSHQWLSCNAHLVEGCVNIVHEVVALVDRCLDHSLNSLTLKPWLPVGEVNMCMRSEERIESTELVELNKKIISCLTVEARNVRTSEWMSSDTELK